MNTVWSRGIELVRDNFQLLIVIAAMFVLLPTLAIYLLIPDFQMLADPTADQEVVAERMGELVGPLLGVGAVAAVFQFAGYGAMVALMGGDRPTVAQALGTGFKIVPSTLAIMILFAIAYVIGAVIIILPISLLVGVAGAPALGFIGIIPVLIFVVWLMARMSLSMPVLALGGTLNPITAITTSFRLTGPKQWQILLFWGVLFVAFTVISLLFNGIVGVLAALLGTGTLALLIAGLANGLTGMVSGMIICGLAVAMFTQLSGPSVAAIEDTFE
ncbi:hypothetical protein [Qipengyuania sp. ASV99]|uniref:hypothetical protein n=1 Tax=Qipengyuania sp. ASV99 TaxID=3399681 RepID=UPI003A4C6231